MMKRDLKKLANEEYDLLIVGGGIYGVTLAWDAVLRGLKVAIIEKGDFASGTSSNSLKIIHGGLRYLQHADFARMRESIIERRILLRIAPHLISPMPCVMPTSGHAVKGPEVMRIGLMMNDIFSADRNWGLDPAKRLPAGKIISKSKMLDIMPFYQQDKLNGGALWYDAHMPNSERLLLSFLRSATEKGVAAAKYLFAENLILNNGRVSGVKAKDLKSSIKLKTWFNSALLTDSAAIEVPSIPLYKAQFSFLLNNKGSGTECAPCFLIKENASNSVFNRSLLSSLC